MVLTRFVEWENVRPNHIQPGVLVRRLGAAARMERHAGRSLQFERTGYHSTKHAAIEQKREAKRLSYFRLGIAGTTKQ